MRDSERTLDEVRGVFIDIKKFRFEFMDVYYQCRGVTNQASSHIVPDACSPPKSFQENEGGFKQCYEGKIENTSVLPNELHRGSNSSDIVNSESPKTTVFCFTKRRTKREPIELKSHIQVIAGNPPIYKCDICKKSFKTKAHVHYHDFCLGKDRPLQCDVCGAGFITKAHLKYHLSTHTGECSFVCNECGEAFNHRGKLLKHICHSGRRGRELISYPNIPWGGTGMYDPRHNPSTSGAPTASMTRGAAVAQELEARLQSLNSYRENEEKIQHLKLKTAEMELAIVEQQMRHNEELFTLEKNIKEELFALDKKIKEQQLKNLQDKWLP